MCGICGVIGVDQPEAAASFLRRMLDALRHRGPDDEGQLAAPPVGLGIRRLSIIDLPGGHQPLWNETETLAVVFNGEIYNFPELRRELESLGHRFRTRSDTEVIVHAYEAWGADCVEHLRGMFAFAIVEMPGGPAGAPQRVFLARDRLGIKPLYYALVDGVFLFASELRALVATGLLSPKLSPSALESYLLFGSVGEPMTLVEGAASLPPGHRMFVPASERASRVHPEPYWDLKHVKAGAAEARSPNGAPAKTLRALLEESVRGHLLADVPLGVFLSSGIDSTALTALASHEQTGLHTFTVIFPEQDFSEAELARRTAKRFGTQHQEFLLSGDEMQGRLNEALAGFDQPSMDGINTYFVSWAARQAGLKVALSGLGSDEIFGGYSTFLDTPRVDWLAAAGRRLPAGMRVLAARAIEKAGALRGQPDAARKLAAAWVKPGALPHSYYFTRALFTPAQALSLLRDKESEMTDPPWLAWLVRTARESTGLDGFSAISWLELRSYLASTLLRDTDAMSMAHSLEVRVPFLDHLLVEFVLGLPTAQKRRPRVAKALLIEALGELLPAEVAAQRKRTFTLPWEAWLRGPLRARVAEGLLHLSPALEPFLEEEGVRQVWKDFLAGRTSWSRPWSLYVLNEWARRHLESLAPRAAMPHTAAATSAR